MTDQQSPGQGPNIVITAGDMEDPEEVSGEPVDERDVLGGAAFLADPALHQAAG